MNFLRKTLSALALGAAVLAGACVESDQGADAQNVIDSISDSLMPNAPVSPGAMSVARKGDGAYVFRVLGDNGEEVLLSQDYVEKASAINGILSVEENGVLLERYEPYTTDDGGFGFTLEASNGQVIAESLLYRSQEEADAGIEAARTLVAGIVQYKAAITHGARFEVWRADNNKKWYFQMRSEDGRVLLASQGYSGRTNAVTGVESVRVNGKDEARYSVKTESSGAYFILKASNGKEIARSAEPYYGNSDEAEAAIVSTSALIRSERVAAPW